MLSVQTENKHLLLWVVAVLMFFISGEMRAQNYSPPEITQESRHAISERANSKAQFTDDSSTQVSPTQPKKRSSVTYSTRSVLQKDSTDTSAQNSVRTRSVEAGRIIRPHGQPSCMNCGVISHVYPPGYPRSGGGYGGNAMTGIPGGVAIPFGDDGEGRFIAPISSIAGNTTAYPNQASQGQADGRVMYYDIGVMLENGTQTVVRQAVKPHFNVGERVKLIDGVLFPNP
ncbi:MAG: hypothetical protein IPI97_00680 [Nitrosomonas sp.]|nr:hypothetical protein [Nitrosomonas sp.]